LANPTIPATDNTDSDPTIENDSGGKDEILNKINKTIERYKNEDN